MNSLHRSQGLLFIYQIAVYIYNRLLSISVYLNTDREMCSKINCACCQAPIVSTFDNSLHLLDNAVCRLGCCVSFRVLWQYLAILSSLSLALESHHWSFNALSSQPLSVS